MGVHQIDEQKKGLVLVGFNELQRAARDLFHRAALALVGIESLGDAVTLMHVGHIRYNRTRGPTMGLEQLRQSGVVGRKGAHVVALRPALVP